MERILYLVRGLPGSGKTTLAKSLTQKVLEADQYFVRNGVYRYVPSQTDDAHRVCRRDTERAMFLGHPVAVANTFSQNWEMEPYRKLAFNYKYQLRVIDLFDAGCSDAELAARNVHQVPESAIAKLRERWEVLP